MQNYGNPDPQEFGGRRIMIPRVVPLGEGGGFLGRQYQSLTSIHGGGDQPTTQTQVGDGGAGVDQPATQAQGDGAGFGGDGGAGGDQRPSTPPGATYDFPPAALRHFDSPPRINPPTSPSNSDASSVSSQPQSPEI